MTARFRCSGFQVSATIHREFSLVLPLIDAKFQPSSDDFRTLDRYCLLNDRGSMSRHRKGVRSQSILSRF